MVFKACYRIVSEHDLCQILSAITLSRSGALLKLHFTFYNVALGDDATLNDCRCERLKSQGGNPVYVQLLSLELVTYRCCVFQ